MADEPEKKEEVKDEGETKVLKVKAFTTNEEKGASEKPPEDTKKKMSEEKPEETKEKVEPKETEDKPKEEEKPVETKAEEPKEAAKAPAAVASFSQLDQEKGDKPKEEEKEEKKEEPKKETLVVPSDEAADPEKHKVSSDEVKKWLSDTHAEESKEVEKKRGINFKVLFVIFIILALIAVIVGGVYYYRSRVPGEAEVESPSSDADRIVEITPANSPTPTVAEEVDGSEYTLQILNGSGIPGEAGVVEALLEDIEFADITTGNADSYDYTDTEVQMKEEVPNAVFEAISEALEESYTVGKNEDVLNEDSEQDVIIIVGVKI